MMFFVMEMLFVFNAPYTELSVIMIEYVMLFINYGLWMRLIRCSMDLIE